MGHWFHSHIIPLAEVLPLELFVFLISFIEEIIPPVPAFPFLLTAGSLAQIQSYTLASLLLLGLISAIGKTIGAIGVYHVADKLEDIVMDKFGKKFGLTGESIEKFGAKFGKGWVDYLILTSIRAIPLMPSTLVSFGSGFLRIKLKLFIIATLLGTFVRDTIYLSLGYFGIHTLQNLKSNGSLGTLFFIKILFIFALIYTVLFFYFRYMKKTVNTSE